MLIKIYHKAAMLMLSKPLELKKELAEKIIYFYYFGNVVNYTVVLNCMHFHLTGKFNNVYDPACTDSIYIYFQLRYSRLTQ